MSIKMKKRDTRRRAASPECNTTGVHRPRIAGTVDLTIAYAVIALILGSVLAGLAACQMGQEESLPLPPALPEGNIVGPGEGANRVFTLDWKRPNGVLRADGNYGQDTVAALKALVEKWKEYEVLLDPLMYIDGSNPRNYAVYVATGDMLNNNQSVALVLQRYWPKDAGPLTGASWTAALDKRKAAFLTAKGKIQEMMDELKQSAFWETESDEVDVNGIPIKPLQQLHGRMETFIYDPGNYTDLLELNSKTVGTARTCSLHETESGALYELYFGHIPENIEYSESNGKKPYDNP